MAQDSITIERIDQEPFVVRRGDRVKVWFHQGYFKPMQVIGISPTRNMIRVSSSGAVRKVGFEVFKAFVFPPDPEPAPPKQKGAANLSRIVERVNAKNAPPGGWSEADYTR